MTVTTGRHSPLLLGMDACGVPGSAFGNISMVPSGESYLPGSDLHLLAGPYVVERLESSLGSLKKSLTHPWGTLMI